MRSVFEGVKIVDFSWILAGPMVSTYLGAYGATVVRIESNTIVDGLRTSAPNKDGVPGVDRSGFYGYINPNKYSITLDLGNPKGRELAKRLVLWSDIVNENFVPGTMEKWGLGYDELTKIKPDIIMVRSSIAGQTGPWAKRRGLGILAASQAGFSSITGWPDGKPCTSYIGYTDFISPRFCITALIAALSHRRKTGKGTCIDVSQFEPALHFLAPVALDYSVNQRVAKPHGNSSTYMAPHGIYRCKGDDRWCAISIWSGDQWRAFCDAAEHPEWSVDPRFSTLLSRNKNETELNRLVEEWTRERSPEQIMETLQARGVPVGVVKNIKDLTEDPQLKSRGHIWWLDHPVMGAIPHMSSTVVLSKTPAQPKSPSPCLGEHTAYVCREFLGISDDEFINLMEEGAFHSIISKKSNSSP